MKLKIRHILVALILLALWAAYLAMVDRRFYIFEGESSHYLLMAKSLAVYHNYSDFYLAKPLPHVKIPPLFSVLLAPIYYFFGFNILAVKTLVFLCLIAATIIGYLLFLKLSGDWKKALPVMVISLLFPLNYILMRKLTSEFPYLALSYLALFLLAGAETKELSVFKSLGLGVLIGLCFLMRSAGLTLVLALAAFMVMDRLLPHSRRSWGPRFAILLTSAAISLWWILRCALVRTAGQFTYFQILLADTRPGSIEQGMLDLQPPLWAGPHMIGLAGMAQRCFHNLIFYLKAIILQPANAQYSYIFLLLLIFALPGMIVSFRKSLILGFYGILNLALILVWPFQDPRFLSPITGIIIFWIIQGADFISSKFKPRSVLRIGVNMLCYGLLAVALLGFCRSDFQIWKQTRHQVFPAVYRVSKYFEVAPLTKERNRFCRALFYLRQNTPRDSVVASVSPHLVSLIADRRAAFFPATPDPKEFWTYFQENRVNYILRDEIYREIGGVNLMTPEYLEPALAGRSGLEKVWAIPFTQTMILSINNEAQ